MDITRKIVTGLRCTNVLDEQNREDIMQTTEKEKLLVTEKDLTMIKDFAATAFKNRLSFSYCDSKEIQVICILVGIESFLRSKGIDPNFEFKQGVK